MVKFDFSFNNGKIAGTIVTHRTEAGDVEGYLEYENYSIANIVDEVLEETRIVTNRSEEALQLRNTIQSKVISAINEFWGIPLKLEIFDKNIEILIADGVFNDRILETVFQKTLQKLNDYALVAFEHYLQNKVSYERGDEDGKNR